MTSPKAHIVQREDGEWVSIIEGNQRASVKVKTQREAYIIQRERFNKASGGEILIHGRDGKIREKNTISPMKDKYPPKG
ncbi:DUF2188 domain-containing protein [Gallibacterium genomosp. 3]|uniref:DUF2188 domain-containing protein n=1 Tax=Gallibacterium genomosp. 3 TaxID=505345 RepID=A0A1A7NN40_9PAST|nr:DUF2188 domain-containing protein [Gallibacterium genomosp. 3]OBW90946.1 hypothetical protein QV01_09120 [Gallibacterium genomosp. 3]OBX09984.1 hypothetical protein QV07_04485 [Gallibacterium genomosp. 3]